MTTDSNRALVEAVDLLEQILDGEASIEWEGVRPIIAKARAALVPAQEVAGLVEEIGKLLSSSWLESDFRCAQALDMIEAFALSPPTQGADRLELAAADDNRKALVRARMNSVSVSPRGSRYHLLEDTITLKTVDGVKTLGEGWLLISEEEYFELAQPQPDVSGLVEELKRRVWQLRFRARTFRPNEKGPVHWSDQDCDDDVALADDIDAVLAAFQSRQDAPHDR